MNTELTVAIITIDLGLPNKQSEQGTEESDVWKDNV